MKKFLFFAFACIAFVALATSSSSTVLSSTGSKTESTTSEREEGHCVCGGKLTYDSKAIARKVPCFYCHGTGIIGMGNNKYTCTYCKGEKTIIEYEGAYRCTSCNRIYDSW